MEKQQKIGVSGFIFNENKLLIVRRPSTENFLPNYYEMPGGHVEFGESPEGALIREIQEEVNLEIEPLYPFNTFSYISNKGNKHTIDIQYIVRVISEISELKLNKEHDDFIWITQDEIKNFKFSEETKDAIIKGFKNLNL